MTVMALTTLMLLKLHFLLGGMNCNIAEIHFELCLLEKGITSYKGKVSTLLFAWQMDNLYWVFKKT